MESKFEGNFTQQDAIPEIAIERANEVLRSGRLHRYNLAENEIGEVGLLETEFAKFVDKGILPPEYEGIFEIKDLLLLTCTKLFFID